MTIQILNRGGPVFAIAGHYDERVRDVCKATPGMQWSKPHRAWVGYGDAVDTAAKQLRQQNIAIVGDVKRIQNDSPVGVAICYEHLRDYQREGVNFLVNHAAEGCFLTDGLSLGKTIQAIRAMRAFKEKAVVVCPNSVKGVWEAELKKWWPAANVVNLTTKMAASCLSGDDNPDATTDEDAYIDNVDVAVIHYDILYAWEAHLQAWGARTLVLDECHRIVGGKSRRAEALIRLARSCPRRIGLTGTVNPNHTKDLWLIADIISENRFGRFFDFGRRYCDGKQVEIEMMVDGAKVPRAVWDWSGSSNEEELKRRMSFFMLGRTKQEVNIQLPAVTRQIVEIDVGRPKKLATAAAALRSNAAFRTALDIAADAKQPTVIEMVAGYIAEGKKVVVASYRKKIAHLVADGVAKAAKLQKSESTVVTGETPVAKRHTIIATKPQLLCCTMDSLGVGVSLAYADLLLFAELHYDPTALMQMEGRLPRSDSLNENVHIVYAIARGTADDIIKRIVLKKLDTRTKTIGAVDNKLFADLQGNLKEDAATRMRKLYERMMKEDE